MTLLRRTTALVAGPVLAFLLASTVAAGPDGPRSAHGTFVDGSGAQIGWLKLQEDQQGTVHVNVKVKGLTTGLHGIHIHAVGSCTTTVTAFDGAGGHYNPLGREHGLENLAGPHAGDLPNLVVDADGRGTLNVRTDRVSLGAGPATLFDANGSALIIHANPDDQVTNIGNGGSGPRIACAVVVAD
ncbi:MAG: superoxide dismutase family protein [Chloroflexota bacterium]